MRQNAVKRDVGGQTRLTFGALCVAFLGLSALTLAGDTRSKADQPNPVGTAAFYHSLPKDDQVRHALSRLCFGPRPGDFAQVQALGLTKWLDGQLHPEQIPENPVLAARLGPLQTLSLSIGDTYLRYPSPQIVAAVARGRAPLPDDPQQRVIIEHLVQHYRQKKLNSNDNAQPSDPADDSDLEVKTQLKDVLTLEQITVLKSGKPDEKRAVLASIPSGKQADFVWALKRDQRRPLFGIAPVQLRRQLMLSVNPQEVVASDLVEGKLLRAIYSTHQLQELLVDFWFNHFNVFVDKGADHYLVPSYERDAIRPHVFGKFYDLLLATAQSPAMLFYLDNWESVSNDAPQLSNSKVKRGLNENYGRELLELHTLGVEGGYTQQDVIEVARCFTGWTIDQPRKSGEFKYNDKVHDKGRKVVLGHVIPAGGGMNDGLEVLNILAHHPATAHFISLKLAQRFVADAPPASLVDRMAETFLNKDGDLREVMRTMITSREFWSAGAYQAKIKTPFEMVVSAARASNADVQSAFLLGQEVGRLGEPLYRKIEPTGYSSMNAEWVSSAGLLERMNFAIALAHNRVPGISIETSGWQAQARENPMGLASSLLEEEPSGPIREAIEKALSNTELQNQLAADAKAGPPQVPSLIAGLTLGSPDFQRR